MCPWVPKGQHSETFAAPLIEIKTVFYQSFMQIYVPNTSFMQFFIVLRIEMETVQTYGNKSVKDQSAISGAEWFAVV